MQTKQRHIQSTFKPWQENYRAANIIGAFGAIWLCVGLVWCAVAPTLVAICFAMIPVAPFYFLFSHREHGSKRKYGIALERAAVARLLQQLPEGWHGRADVQLPHSNANTDCLLTLSNGHQCTIDVKAWHGLRQDGRRLVKTAKSAKGADVTKIVASQMWHQIIALKVQYGILWLPKARYQPTFIFRGFYVVQGEVGSLLVVLRLLDIPHVDYVAHFQRAPDATVLATLKAAGFRWNKEDYSWQIKLTPPAVLDTVVIAEIKNAGGYITPDDFVPPPVMTITEQFAFVSVALC